MTPRSGVAARLRGMRVLVTRPTLHAGDLVRAIAAGGGEPIGFPTIDIVAPRDPVAARAAIDALGGYHLAIFVSATAVERAMELLGGCDWPPGLPVAVLGAATARALARYGVDTRVICPQGRFDSESLLADPALQPRAICGRCVALLKGEGGRDAIELELGRRGAQVRGINLYRRVRPNVSATEIVERGQCGGIDVIVITSGDGARNLFELGGEAGRRWLCNADYLVLSDRIAGVLAHCGVRGRVRIANQASDAALLAGLEQMAVEIVPLAESAKFAKSVCKDEGL